MSDPRPAAFIPALPRRSQGLKLLLVCALALIMTIPALFVFALLADRTHRSEQVTREIGGLVGGPQTFLGPVLAVPYAIPSADPKVAPTRGVFVVFPASGEAKVDEATEVRRRSLFKVPVYKADVAFRGTFDLSGALAQAPEGAILDWTRAEILVGATDARGAKADVALTAGGKTLPVAPASTLASAQPGDTATSTAAPYRPDTGGLDLFGAPAAGVAAPEAKFEVTAKLKFTGAERISILPFAKATTIAMTGDWGDPSFDGGFLPEKRTVSEKGFTAGWSIPFIARGVPAQGPADVLGRLGPTAVGVSFVEPANPYQSVSRSLKYAPMFVGLVFLAFFIFETLQGRRVHPAQYVLIGLAQVIFYALLLSIAERVGFDAAFLIAAGATVALISAYAGWVFESRKQGVIALIAFTLLYSLIYVLMRLEDLALLVGAVVSFAAIAAVMYFTRKIDWYGGSGPAPSSASKESV